MYTRVRACITDMERRAKGVGQPGGQYIFLECLRAQSQSRCHEMAAWDKHTMPHGALFLFSNSFYSFNVFFFFLFFFFSLPYILSRLFFHSLSPPTLCVHLFNVYICVHKHLYHSFIFIVFLCFNAMIFNSNKNTYFKLLIFNVSINILI